MGAHKLYFPILVVLLSVLLIPVSYKLPSLAAELVRFGIGVSLLMWLIFMYFKYLTAPDEKRQKVEASKDIRSAKKELLDLAKEIQKRRAMDFPEDDPSTPQKGKVSSEESSKDESSKTLPVGTRVKIKHLGGKEGVIELFVPSIDMVVKEGPSSPGYRVRMDDNNILYFTKNQVEEC